MGTKLLGRTLSIHHGIVRLWYAPFILMVYLRSSQDTRPPVLPSACIAAVAHIIATTDPTAPKPSTVAFPLGLTGYTLPLVTNAIATALIVARLYLTARRAQRDPTREASTVRAAMRAMTIIVESGALYLATQLTFVVLFAVRHPALAIVSVMAAQIYVSDGAEWAAKCRR